MSAYKKKAYPKHREAEKSQLLFLHSSDVDVSGTHTLHVTFTHLIPDPQTRSHGRIGPGAQAKEQRTVCLWKLSVGGRVLLELLQGPFLLQSAAVDSDDAVCGSPVIWR